MRAVDAIMECLKAEGVEVIFGLPGGANLPTYDALYDAGIRHVLVRHEAGGGHAAEGYAKATGKVGVCFATSGPGATNVVTPIMDAMMDSCPVVFVTGQVRTDLLGTDGFQETDVIGITMPAVKHSFMILHPLDLPRAIHEAFHIAGTGRPGPVVVDIPTDLSRTDDPYEPVTDLHLPGYSADDRGQREADPSGGEGSCQLRCARCSTSAAAAINAGAHEEVASARRARALPGHLHAARHRRLPGRRMSSRSGMLGMHGTRTANYAMDEADLICAIGARFDDRITGKLSEFAPEREVHPHRHRSCRDLQERPGAHPDHRRREEHRRQAGRPNTAPSRASTGRGSTRGGHGSATGRPSIR